MVVLLTVRASALAIVLLSPSAVSASGARADSAAASACAAQLPKDARTIFNAALPQLAANADLRSVVTASTRQLVTTGSIDRGTARQSAIEAAKCLKLKGG